MGSLLSTAEALPPDARKGKVVVITGCDSGIGLQLATHAAHVLGFNVVAACLTIEGERRAQEALGAAGTTVQADLVEAAGIQKLVSAAEMAADSVPGAGGSGSGGIWALVNNAGAVSPGLAYWNPPSVYEATMAVNFHVPVQLIYALLPRLMQEQGRIVNVTSVCGMVPLPMHAPYCASKHALEAYSDSLRVEMKPWGVKVIIIQPSTMRTPLAMASADQFLRGFQNAPAERRAPFGDEWAREQTRYTTEQLEKGAEDPDVVVQAIAEALVVKHPKIRYPAGKAANILCKPLSLLPDCARDGLLKATTYCKTMPAGLAGKQ